MYLILSDIHANLTALEAVMQDANEKYCIEQIIILGDTIDYGMRSNQVISFLKQFSKSIICNLWGNHEQAIMEEAYTKFSSERGILSAKRTAKMLTEESCKYLKNSCNMRGQIAFDLESKKCLAIHGSKEDSFWVSIEPDQLHGDYREYDIVFSGHSHIPHYFIKCYETDCIKIRNRKPVVFVNPGSVGQPRNRNPKAQYAVLELDSMTIHLHAVEYDIESEQCLFTEDVDVFYKERLTFGI